MGGAQAEVTPPKIQKKTFLPCEISGIKSQALPDTGAEVKIISEDVYYQADIA